MIKNWFGTHQTTFGTSSGWLDYTLHKWYKWVIPQKPQNQPRRRHLVGWILWHLFMPIKQEETKRIALLLQVKRSFIKAGSLKKKKGKIMAKTLGWRLARKEESIKWCGDSELEHISPEVYARPEYRGICYANVTFSFTRISGRCVQMFNSW